MADPDEEKETVGEYCRRSVRRTSVNSYVVQRNAKVELREKVKKVSEILKKTEQDRTAAEKALVKKYPEIVKTSERNARRLEATKSRVLEIEDEPQALDQKCDQLADLLRNADRIVVYTGAGISTAASIPDYRGPNGVWTLLKKGQEPSAQDLSDAEPTFTHMSITKLFRAGLVKHIVSQNCDGLHIRSGYPRYALSEVHGNMYIECCYSCNPHKEYIRLFDVTEKTGVRRHTTGRRCRTCGSLLTDTIVHFGEKGKIKSPYRWKEAVRAAKNADLILCLGSSLKILRRYACLWAMDRKPHQRPKLVIVNLQWTPKDDLATLKINGRCDYVMKRVMKELEYEVPEYKRETDPIFKLCTPLRASELKTTSKKILIPPFLPAKTPSKTSKNSRQKKSRSRRGADDIKPEKCATVSSKSEIKEESVSVKDESKASRDENSSFPKLFIKSEIKADWDTPILALDPSDQTPNIQQAKEEPNQVGDHKSDLCTSSKESDSFNKETSHIKSEFESENCVNENSTTKSEPYTDKVLRVKDKTPLENLPLENYEVIDVVLVEQSPQDPTDIYQVNLDGITPSLPPACHVQLAGETWQDHETDNGNNGIRSEFKLSHFQDEAFQSAEYMSENLEFTQPVPGTVVIDLEVVDELVGNFSTGKTKLAQVGMSLNNVLLINLDSKQVNDATCLTEETLTQTSLCTDTYSLLGKASGKDLQESTMFPTKLQQPSHLTPIVLDSMHLSQGHRVSNKLFGSSALLSSAPSPCSIPKMSPERHYAQSIASVATVSVKLDSGTNLMSPIQNKSFALSPQQPKPMSLPFEQKSFHFNSELPVSLHETSSSKHQLQTVFSLTASVAEMPSSCATPLKVSHSDVQIGSKSLPFCNGPLTSAFSACQSDKFVETIKRKDHENLRQLLSKPVAVQSQTPDSSYIGFTAKKLISSIGLLDDKTDCLSDSDHAYSQKAKEKAQAHQKNSLVTKLPLDLKRPKQIRELTNLEVQVTSESQKGNMLSSSVSQFTPLYGPYENKHLASKHDANNIIKTSTPVKSVQEHSNMSVTTMDKLMNLCPGSSSDSPDKVDSVPLCVLNMDDIFKPKSEDNPLSIFTGAHGISQGDCSQQRNVHCNSLQETIHNSSQHKVSNHRSISPFQAVSLVTSLSSPQDALERENSSNEGMNISTEIDQPVNCEKEVQVLPNVNGVAMMDYSFNVSDCCSKLNVIDNYLKKTKDTSSVVNSDVCEQDAHHSPAKDLTKSPIRTVKNNAKSRKRHSTSPDSHPLKPVSQSSPVQNMKNNNDKTCKPQKRSVGRPRKNFNNTKLSSESTPGWFGKGLAIKIKRKRKT